MEQQTRRLRLLAGTAETVAAELEDRAVLAGLLGARVPAAWPPEALREALPVFRRWHREHPDWVGWLDWYAVRLDRATPILCGSAGFHGPPGEEGAVEVGYSLLPAHRHRGLATEMVVALVDWARAHPGVRRVEAETAAGNAPSIGVLERVGFRLAGPGRGPDSLRYRLP